jgi:hypothetical protein
VLSAGHHLLVAFHRDRPGEIERAQEVNHRFPRCQDKWRAVDDKIHNDQLARNRRDVEIGPASPTIWVESLWPSEPSGD